MKLHHVVAALALAACTPPSEKADTTAAAAVEAPAEAVALIQAEMPGLTITSIESEEVLGQTEWEIAGATADGVEYEFDMMQSSAGWSINEIQRDIAWDAAPEPVRAAAAAAPNAFAPARVIESRQIADGSTIYELFDGDDPAGAPSMEIRFMDGEAAVMPPAH